VVAAASGRALALRHGAELKVSLLRQGRLAEALALVEGMLPLAPDDDRLWREAGMMHLRLDHPAQAVAALDQYLTRARDPGQRAHATRLVAELRGRLPDVLPGRTDR
jgi:regulator of sirC expression with transglutaminase-like and TPR domain